MENDHKKLSIPQVHFSIAYMYNETSDSVFGDLTYFFHKFFNAQVNCNKYRGWNILK